MNRRFFIKSGGLALAGLGLSGAIPGVLQSLASAQTRGRPGKTLIVIFQRGAVDGLSMLVPYAEAAYYAARRTIAIPRPGQAGGALDLDGRFGLHPALQPLQTFWKDRRMTAITAVGSPDNTRSHFDAQDYMESGTPGSKSTRDGWMNRLLQAQTSHSPFTAVAMDAQLPRSLAGPAPAVAMTNLAQFAIDAGRYTGQLQGGFEGLWEQRNQGGLGDTGRETFEAVQALKRSGAAARAPEHGATYPTGALGTSLRQLAQLIKADVGLRLGFAEAGGWDTHVNQGAAQGQLANGLRDFGGSIAAFLTDLGPAREDVVVVTMSEFGRTLRENGSRGTDHGHGNTMFVLGAGVNGGKVLGDWPGLAPEHLFEGRDLAITTDFRDVLGELAQAQLGVAPGAGLFPGHVLKPRGLLAA
ncbi:DUF1501 domain-containing protein [Arenimonas oryziterrae]|uniref:DUF1501 domain-containing protein n=1 Tax=Arenimonas oryziterrae DSM 21050 = YC6267 TaxID=1121015 RepID=A0A091AXM9_9GAMM|nr:DUF1501 domain-containing protein [Arenimonas oryziterrae]KFN44032.1 hypothetical protein N789_06355 [Arenimonas oryziterrae DSM 21050 = YC6267]